jgi:hypothetical protein
MLIVCGVARASDRYDSIAATWAGRLTVISDAITGLLPGSLADAYYLQTRA